jgi:hypothetical protein
MNIADIIISLITFVIQKMITPLLPTNLPLISYATFTDLLSGSLKHNLEWSFAGLNQLFNLQLLFILLGSMVFAEILFWLVRVALFIVKLIRGGG